MSDLPTPQNAAEAALFSEYWDAVLSYADLCTSGSQAANQLATEAFALGMREARAAGSTAVRGTGRRAPRLPMIPLLLTAVRSTAAAWEADGVGHRLDPDLRLWLNSEKAARYTGPPLQRPVALRGLRDMQEADAALLWLAEVEALPLSAVARRLGLDPGSAAQELDQVRALFRDRCHRAHLDTPLDAPCRSYARLLDAVTRSPVADTPDDLSRHLATCVRCAEAAACLRLHGGGLPAALAGGVIGWGGLAYLERRRRAAEVRMGAVRTETDTDAGDPKDGRAGHRVLRNSLLATAVLLSLLALGVSMMPFDGSGEAGATAQDGPRPTADPGPSSFSVDPVPSASATPKAHPSRTPGRTNRKNPDPEPQGSSSSSPDDEATSAPATSAPATTEAPTCRVDYDVADEWPDGFQATVTVHTTESLSDWHLAWTFRDGQRIGQTWDATSAQTGTRVTATAVDYNKSVSAGTDVTFGFLASWHDANSAPSGFTLNGQACGRG